LLLKTLLVLGLLCSQAGAPNGCLPDKDRKALDKKSEPIERFLLLARIGERQASRLRGPFPAHATWDEQGPYRGQRSPAEVLDVHDCAWSELLEELFSWKPQLPHDRNAIQELLRRARSVEKQLTDFRQTGTPYVPAPIEIDSRLQKSLQRIHEVEERLLTLSE
jgi:hypothetical protein